MSRAFDSSRLARMVLLGAAGLAAAGISPVTIASSMACSITSYETEVQDPYGGGSEPEFIPFPQIPGDEGMLSGNRRRAKTAKKKATTTDKSKTKKADSTAKDKTTSKKGADSGKLRFSKDIAPILVANCTACHSGEGAGLKRGKLDLSTFDTMQARKVVVGGNPDDSKLLLRLKGEIEPRMPQGANAKLSDAAIAKIERWIKEGATLDAGNDPKKPIASYAASAREVRKAEVAKLPPGERDKKTEEVGLQRYKQANPSVKPDVVATDHFMIFSVLPKDRATNTLKLLETQYGHLRRILGAEATAWPEKVSIYAFSARKDYIEFARTVEQRAEVDAEEFTSGRLTVTQPYVAIVDPQGGRKDEPGAGKRKARGRRGDEKAGDTSSADRSFQGLLTEALGSSVVATAGSPPRWLSVGIGSYLSSQVEPRSPYYRQLRQTAFANYQQGWPTRAMEALGGSDQITPEGLRSIAFAIVEAMMSSEMRQRFPNFVAGMLEGGNKLDDTLQQVYDGTREEFLNATSAWVEQKYGQLR